MCLNLRLSTSYLILNSHLFSWVCLLLATGCAPVSWLNEAQSLAIKGSLNEALNRYEDALLAQSPSVAYDDAIMTIDHLATQKLDELSQRLDLADTHAACLAALDLESLTPASGLALTPLLNLLQQTSTRLMADHSDDDFRETLSLHQSLELAHCPLERSPEYVLALQAKLAEHFQTQLSHSISPDNLWRLRETLLILHKAGFRSQDLVEIDHITRSLWREEWSTKASHPKMEDHLGLRWIYHSLSINLPFAASPATSTSAHPSTHEVSPHEFFLALTLVDLEEELSDLQLRGCTLTSSSQDQDLQTLIDSHIPSLPAQKTSYSSWLAPYQVEEWVLHDQRAQCKVKSVTSFQEHRYLDRVERVRSSQYLAALKRVELQQGVLEAAQSQYEELTNALDTARRSLDDFQMTELYTAEQDVEDTLNALRYAELQLQHLAAHERSLSPEHLVGPPDPKLPSIRQRYTEAFRTSQTRFKTAKIRHEIATTKLDDYRAKLVTVRSDVKRLSRDLVSTQHEADEAEQLLEEREKLLKTKPPYQEEKIFSVFRYPVTEHQVTCTLQWTINRNALPEIVGPPSSLYPHSEDHKVLELSLSETSISHRSFPKYRITSKASTLEKIKSKLVTKLNTQLMHRLTHWFSERRSAWLKRLGENFLTELDQVDLISLAQLNRLALFTYMYPQRFAVKLSGYLLPSLSQRSKLTLPNLLQWAYGDQRALNAPPKLSDLISPLSPLSPLSPISPFSRL